MPSPRNLASSPKTFLDRDNWMRAVLASDLPDAAARVALAIGFHLNVDSGQCNPSFPTIAVESHVSERSTYRLIDLLEHRGWLAVTRISGRGNQYTLLTPDKTVTGVTPDKGVTGVPLPNRGPTPAKSEGAPLPKSGGTPANMLAGEKREQRRKRKEGKESESRPPDFASRESKNDAPAKKKKSAANHDEPFEEFWRGYPRRVAKEAAHKAYAAAIKRGIKPETMNEGAKRYAGERAGQDPKYTKHPATWINGGCWEDEPPAGAIIDQEGNLVAVEQPPPQRKRTGYTAIADELIAELETNGPEIFGWGRR
jgi:hypothetical protein